MYGTKGLIGLVVALMLASCDFIESQTTSPLPERSSEATYAIVGATVLVMDSAPLDSGTVIVRDEIIKEVGTDIVPAPEMEIIDAEGMFMMPGLADMHGHYFRNIDGPLYIANGVTTLRNLWGRAAIIEIGAASEAKAFPGPRVVTSGPIMDGPDPIWQTSLSVTTPEMAVGAVRAQQATGYPAIKLYERLDADVYRAAVEEARRLGMQVWAHTPDSLTIDDILELQIDSLEHLDNIEDVLLPDELPSEIEAIVDFPTYVRAFTQKWAAADVDKITPLAHRFADAGVANTPTMAVISDSGALMHDLDGFFASEEGQTIDSFYQQSWSAEARVMTALLDLDLIAEARAKKLLFIKALYDAGAPLLIGTDTPNPFVTPGYSLHRELAAFEEAGIPRGVILELATKGAAEFLGESDVFGRVAPGLRADLLILESDPRESLETLRKPQAVLAGGTYHDRAALDALLAEARQRVAAGTVEQGDARSSTE
ncbi:MAG: amidohydrolase family protein [Pseudomonadota bacterium]